MKLPFFVLIFSLSNSYAQINYSYCKAVDEIARQEQLKNTPFVLSDIQTLASQNFDVHHYSCRWQVDPAVRYIHGEVTSSFEMLMDADTIAFDLARNLTVDSVIYHSARISFTHTTDQLTVRFSGLLAAGSFDSVKIFYQGIPANPVSGSFTNDVHSGTPLLWTLSEPYGSKDWWPCKDGLLDKADSLDVYITAPAQYSGVSNGLKKEVTATGLNKTFHWKHNYPIATYLVCMAVTNYQEFTNTVNAGGKDILMQTFCYPENFTLFQQNTPLVLNSMQYFSGLFGTYPFSQEKYGHVQFNWRGGQEHQTSTFIFTPGENLMSHELAHQWFGDMVTCASWSDIWLNEGFASYLASIDLEQKYPDTVRVTRRAEIENITSVPDGSVWVDDTTNVGRIFNGRLSYRKGSRVLFMLRWILGDQKFLEGVNAYLNDPKVRYAFATTADLQRNLESVSGKDLSKFFQDWVYGQGYPSYQVAWSQESVSKVKVAINQTTSHSSVNFFQLPVSIKFQSAGKEKTVVFDNKSNGESFTADIGFIADSAVIDPDYWLISRANTIQKVPDISLSNFVQIYPAPFRDNLNVFLNNFDNGSGNLEIFDAKGALVLKKTIVINASSFFTISTAALPPGAYIFKLTFGNNFKFTRKLVKN